MTDRTRPLWPAYLLTVLIAGLGHGYLGQWKRGAAWFGLYVLALAFLSARTVSGALEPGDPFVLSALQFEAVSYTDVAVPLAILVVCLLDIYLIGITTRTDSTSDSPASEARSNGSS
jgi:TRAP-type mannitol/chloroaromatic compound transport system permease large subunit